MLSMEQHGAMKRGSFHVAKNKAVANQHAMMARYCHPEWRSFNESVLRLFRMTAIMAAISSGLRMSRPMSLAPVLTVTAALLMKPPLEPC